MIVFHLDDDKAMRFGVQGVVEDAGHEYVGSDQWSEISSRMFAIKGTKAVLLADLHMPGIRGEDFCRTTIKHCPWITIVLHSGSDEANMAAVAKRLGGCRFVQKSAGAAKLLDALSDVLAEWLRAPG